MLCNALTHWKKVMHYKSLRHITKNCSPEPANWYPKSETKTTALNGHIPHVVYVFVMGNVHDASYLVESIS